MTLKEKLESLRGAWVDPDLLEEIFQDVAELERIIAFQKIDQQVTNKSAGYHMQRCRELEQANERANQLIADQAAENDRSVKQLIAYYEQERRSAGEFKTLVDRLNFEQNRKL